MQDEPEEEEGQCGLPSAMLKHQVPYHAMRRDRFAPLDEELTQFRQRVRMVVLSGFCIHDRSEERSRSIGTREDMSKDT